MRCDTFSNVCFTCIKLLSNGSLPCSNGTGCSLIVGGLLSGGEEGEEESLLLLLLLLDPRVTGVVTVLLVVLRFMRVLFDLFVFPLKHRKL